MLQKMVSWKKTPTGEEKFFSFSWENTTSPSDSFRSKESKKVSQKNKDDDLKLAKAVYLDQFNLAINEHLKDLDQKIELAKNEEDYPALKDLSLSKKEAIDFVEKISSEVAGATTVDALKEIIPIELLQYWKFS